MVEDDGPDERRPRERQPLLPGDADVADAREPLHTIPDSCPTLRVAVPVGSDTIPAPPAHDTIIDDLLDVARDRRRPPRD